MVGFLRVSRHAETGQWEAVGDPTLRPPESLTCAAPGVLAYSIFTLHPITIVEVLRDEAVGVHSAPEWRSGMSD